MQPTRILVIQGHPDAGARHLCHALADAYAEGAARRATACAASTWRNSTSRCCAAQPTGSTARCPPRCSRRRRTSSWAQHLVFFFPLWLGDMPALLKGFLEQVARPGFAFDDAARQPASARRA